MINKINLDKHIILLHCFTHHFTTLLYPSFYYIVLYIMLLHCLSHHLTTLFCPSFFYIVLPIIFLHCLTHHFTTLFYPSFFYIVFTHCFTAFCFFQVEDIKPVCRLPCLEIVMLLGNPVTITLDYRTKTLALFGDRVSEVS